MKFKDENKLIKVIFIFFLAVACFGVDNVMAEGTCTYTFNDKEGVSEGTRTFTFKNNELYNDGDAFDKDNTKKFKHVYNDKKKFREVFINGCPNEVYAVKSFDISPIQRNFTITYYLDKAEAEKMAKALSNSTSVGTFYSAALTDKQVCVSTGNSEFFQALVIASELDKADAWSQESDAMVGALNSYLATAKKNKISFCDEKSLAAIETVVSKYNDIVLKDPNAPQDKKDAIKNQSNAIQENIAALKKYTLSNKTNITLPNGKNLNKCEELISEDLMYVINLVLKIIQIGGPILLIILVAVDFGQVVISNDKDAMSKAVSRAIKRAIPAIVIFFVPYLVSLILNWLNNYSSISGAANCIK